MANPALAFTQANLRMLVAKGNFDRILEKVNVISAGGGRAKVELEICKEHTNAGGFAHGGCIASLVDSISTMALMTHNMEKSLPGVSVDLSVQYLSQIPLGSTIVIEAETVKKGRSLAFLVVSLLDKESHKLLARGSHVKFVATPNL